MASEVADCVVTRIKDSAFGRDVVGTKTAVGRLADVVYDFIFIQCYI